jgi:hypothetical protein
MKLYSVSYRVHKYIKKTYVIVRKNNTSVLHIDYEVVSQSTATAYLRIRVTRIRVSRELTVLCTLYRR